MVKFIKAVIHIVRFCKFPGNVRRAKLKIGHCRIICIRHRSCQNNAPKRGGSGGAYRSRFVKAELLSYVKKTIAG